MIAPLSALSSLEQLSLGFQSPQSRPDSGSRCPPPSKRSVIPALKYFYFEGVVEYLEDLVTFIDAPRLVRFYITFFYQVDNDTPRLAQFINRTSKLWKRDGFVRFWENAAGVGLGTFWIGVSCRKLLRQLSFVAQVCNSSLSPLSTVEDLFIEDLFWMNYVIESTRWLELLLPFTAVKNLYLSMEIAPSIAAALRELVGGRITEVLPSLQNIFVERLELSSGPF